MNVSHICSELIKIRSDNPPGNTKDIADYISSLLDSLGIKNEIIEGAPGHCNVVSKDQHKKLMLSGHFDVVPAIADDWEIPPYSGLIDDKYVHGRGSIDMKGGCATIITATERYLNDNDDLPISFTFVCDEESGGSSGIRYLLLKQLIHPCDVIIAEPTMKLGPFIGQKGNLKYEIEFTGNPGHASLYPIIGDSAIMQAFNFLEWVKVLNKREYTVEEPLDNLISQSIEILNSESVNAYNNLDSKEILRHVSYNPGIISGGERRNIVAEKCHLTMDMRLPLGCNGEELLKEIYEHLPKSAKVHITEVTNATITDPESFLVHTTCEAVSSVYNKPSKPILQFAASDARTLRFAGFNAIEYGPGGIEGAHGRNEHIEIDILNKAETIFYKIISEYHKKYEKNRA